MTHLLFKGTARDLLPWLKSIQGIEDALDDGIKINENKYQKRLHYVKEMCHEATLLYCLTAQKTELEAMLRDLRKEGIQ